MRTVRAQASLSGSCTPPRYSSQSIRLLAGAVTGLLPILLSLVLQLCEHDTSSLTGSIISS